jgi:hypothetical protein
MASAGKKILRKVFGPARYEGNIARVTKNHAKKAHVEWRQDVDSIHLGQERVQWRALVNLRIPPPQKKAGNFLTSWATTSFSNILCSMELVETKCLQLFLCMNPYLERQV